MDIKQATSQGSNLGYLKTNTFQISRNFANLDGDRNLSTRLNALKTVGGFYQQNPYLKGIDLKTYSYCFRPFQAKNLLKNAKIMVL